MKSFWAIGNGTVFLAVMPEYHHYWCGDLFKRTVSETRRVSFELLSRGCVKLYDRCQYSDVPMLIPEKNLADTLLASMIESACSIPEGVRVVEFAAATVFVPGDFVIPTDKVELLEVGCRYKISKVDGNSVELCGIPGQFDARYLAHNNQSV